MPHAIHADGACRPLHDVLEVGTEGDVPLLRLHRLDDGDAVVITAVEATRDGAPVVGNLAVVPWGSGALMRAKGVRVEIAWQQGDERRIAAPGQRCRVCFGGLTPGEVVIACPCGAVFHEECDAVRVSCAACGGIAT